MTNLTLTNEEIATVAECEMDREAQRAALKARGIDPDSGLRISIEGSAEYERERAQFEAEQASQDAGHFADDCEVSR